MSKAFFNLLVILVSSSSSHLSAAPHEQEHNTKLVLASGSYTSIFGLIPKTYLLEATEVRKLKQQWVSKTAFSIETVSSESRKILSAEGENASIQIDAKPLTGKNVEFEIRDGVWALKEMIDISLTKEEKKEAERLAMRYSPDLAPFKNLIFDEAGIAKIDAEQILKFLGYLPIQIDKGVVSLKKKEGLGANEKAQGELTVDYVFQTKEEVANAAVELVGQGEIKWSNTKGDVQELTLKGELVIHGQRLLDDGRKVPYNLISDYSYQSSSKEITP